MSTLRFNDGMTIDTSGPLRIVKKRDGYYVVGEGMCIPVDDREDGKEMIKEISQVKNKGE